MLDSDSVKHFIRIIFSLVLLFMLTIPAQAQDDSVWTPRPTCVFAMPYMGHVVMRGGKGLMVELLKSAYFPEKIDLDHQALPYERALAAVKDGTADCTLDIQGRNKKLESKTVPAVYNMAVAYLRENGFKGIKDLTGKRVAFVHGFGIEEYIPVKIKIQLVYDLSSGFHMLERGHASFVLGDERLLKRAMFDSKIPPGIFEITQLKTFNVKMIFAATKAGRFYRDVFDRRMREMMRTGEFAEIMDSYGATKQSIQQVLKVNKGL